MSQARIGNAEILSGEIDLPLVGIGTLEIELGTGDDLPEAGDSVRVEVLAADGPGVAYQGTVRTSGDHEDRGKLFIVLGSGGLGRTVSAKPYANSPTAFRLLDDVVRDAGEALSPTVDETALSERSVNTWLRTEGTGAVALQRIAEHFGYTWRVLADGMVWMGVEAWPAFGGSALYELGQDRSESTATYADAETMAPGVTWEGRKVYRVVHQITPDGTRARVTYDRSERDEFRAAVRGAFPELLYLSSWEGRVIGQNADGTLEIIAYDSRIGGLSKVPIRYGVPGSTWTVPFGARVFVGFAEGRADKAYAGPWWEAAQAGLTNWTLGYSGTLTVNSGTRAVAGIGHATAAFEALWDATTFTLYLAAGYPAGVGGLRVYTIALTIPGGSALGLQSNPASPAAPAPGTPGTVIAGIITDGYSQMKVP
jgi:hypothetical protein